jgi:nicotinate-nucleotide adenylyltransferase
MRLGLFGGTFDPVHLGHLILAEQCREQCGLDQVWFVPSGQPPHKRHAPLTPGRARAEMLEFAIAGHPRFVVSRIELDRDGPTYTVDTLRQLDAEDPSRELFFLMGADSLADLPGWRDPEGIAGLATIVAVNRGDRPLPDRAALDRLLGATIASRVRFVTIPGIDLSATDLRRRVRSGHSLRYLVPRPVEVYIEQHELYRAQDPLP